MTSRKISPTKIGLTALVAVSLVASGALLGAAYVSTAVPGALKPEVRASTFPVGTARFDDSRTVTLEVGRERSTSLVSPGSGRVTEQSCLVGRPIVSGTSPFALDGRPVLALSTSTPLWRDLAVGNKGADVAALQEELTRLDFKVARSGVLDNASIVALNTLFKSAGGTEKFSSVVANRILWLPRPSTHVEDCAVTKGSTVTSGDTIATAPGALLSVALSDVPADLVEGPRVLVVDGVRVDVDPAAMIDDDDVLSELDNAVSLQPSDDASSAPIGRLVLAEPVQVLVVPPSSVLGTPGALCVWSAGKSRDVVVVGSELGQTYVIVDGEPLTDVDVNPARDLSCT